MYTFTALNASNFSILATTKSQKANRIFWRQPIPEKDRFLKFGFKKANLATLAL